jgi:two-component system, NtrC family, response regulator HydG
MPARILVVDDDPHIALALRERLEARGHAVSTAATGAAAVRAILSESPDLVLLDLQLPEGDGFDVLGRIREAGVETTVVVITAHGTVERAVRAMKEGAYDFLQKPFEPSLVEETVRRALERVSLVRRDRSARTLEEPEPIAEDPAMRRVLDLVRRAASSDATVLLLGESGTGKEVLARFVHRSSARAEGPFVPLSCAALSESLLESELFGHEKGAFTGAVERRRGRIELAHGGTLFLDEIGEVSPAFQAKLLRVLEERTFERVGGSQPIRVDLRLLAATNRDLKAAVAAGKFREDLYYRLNVVRIEVPPLRERPADVLPLARAYLERARRKAGRTPMTLSEDAAALLRAYRWPGNVRELVNAIDRAVVLSTDPEVSLDDLPEEILGAPVVERAGGYHSEVQSFKRRLLREVLDRNGGNQTKAAEALGLQRSYFARLLKRFSPSPPTS